MEPLRMDVIDGAIAVLTAEEEESMMHHTMLQALKELREFKELGVSVAQLREIDRLYAEKCREIERYKRAKTQARKDIGRRYSGRSAQKMQRVVKRNRTTERKRLKVQTKNH